VLALEFSQTFFEGMKWERAYKTVKKFTYPLVIAGIVLSFLHQSSLGGVFLIAPAKLSHLWYTPNMPYFFYLSAIAAGLAMVSVEAIVSSRSLKREMEMDILQGLARGARITLVLYLVLKAADMTVQGAWPLLLAGSTAGFFFLAEMLVGVVAPIILYSVKSVTDSPKGLLTAASLVTGGVVFNRFNVNFFAQSGTGTFYFPSVWELLVTVGLVALVIMLYRLAVMHLPVFHEGALKR
jgi:Ni/Fe-hydrogenase subunit HybB-like protein